jgi:hypothetical protein
MWSSFLFVPLSINDDDCERMKAFGWRAWVSRLPCDQREQVSADSEFFIPSARGRYMPSASSTDASARWTFPLDAAHERPKITGESGEALAEVTWVDVFRFPGTAMLAIHLTALSDLDDKQVLWLSRRAAEWVPRFAGDTLAPWHVGGQAVASLRDWVMERLLGLKCAQDCQRVGEASQWFGSSVPALFLLGSAQVPDWTDPGLPSLIEHVCLGIEDEAEQYGPSDNIRSEIGNRFLQEWENWRLYEWRSRMALIYGGEARGGQPENTGRYYVPMIASVLYQKVTITAYLDRFMSGEEDEEQLLRDFTRFRRAFLAHQISSYPLGNRIYEFLREKNCIPETHKDVEDELDTAAQLAGLDLERQEAGLMRNLTILAAVFLPVSAISSIYGADQDQLYHPTSWFWIISSLTTTAVILSLCHTLWTWRKGRHKK